MSWTQILLLAGLASVLSALLLLPIRRWAGKLGAVNKPGFHGFDGRVIPRCGGMVIVPLALAGTWLVHLRLPATAGDDLGSLQAFTLGSLLIAGISLVDDFREVPIVVRLAVHALAALILVQGVGYWREFWLPGPGLIDVGQSGLFITFLWVFGLTNAYNFMDGIDGLAGGQGVVAGIGWTIVLHLGGNDPWLEALALLLAATTAGFLMHNWPPAKIFLGDTGSAFLGFSFAGIGLMAGTNDSRMPVLAGFMVLPFVLDSSLTFWRRAFRGENVLQPHRSHFYQLLVRSGLSHRQVSGIYLVLASLSLGGILLWYWHIIERGWLILTGVCAVTVLFWWWVSSRVARSLPDPEA